MPLALTLPPGLNLLSTRWAFVVLAAVLVLDRRRRYGSIAALPSTGRMAKYGRSFICASAVQPGGAGVMSAP